MQRELKKGIKEGQRRSLGCDSSLSRGRGQGRGRGHGYSLRLVAFRWTPLECLPNLLPEPQHAAGNGQCVCVYGLWLGQLIWQQAMRYVGQATPKECLHSGHDLQEPKNAFSPILLQRALIYKRYAKPPSDTVLGLYIRLRVEIYKNISDIFPQHVGSRISPLGLCTSCILDIRARGGVGRGLWGMLVCLVYLVYEVRILLSPPFFLTQHDIFGKYPFFLFFFFRGGLMYKRTVESPWDTVLGL